MNTKKKLSQILPKIPSKLANQILSKKFGKDSLPLDALFMQKISIEVQFENIRPKDSQIAKELKQEINIIEKKIQDRIEHLRFWYNSYFQLATQCSDCAFCVDKVCSFYGDSGKIKLSTEDKNKKCAHKTLKTNKSPQNN